MLQHKKEFETKFETASHNHKNILDKTEESYIERIKALEKKGLKVKDAPSNFYC